MYSTVVKASRLGAEASSQVAWIRRVSALWDCANTLRRDAPLSPKLFFKRSREIRLELSLSASASQLVILLAFGLAKIFIMMVQVCSLEK